MSDVKTFFSLRKKIRMNLCSRMRYCGNKTNFWQALAWSCSAALLVHLYFLYDTNIHDHDGNSSGVTATCRTVSSSSSTSHGGCTNWLVATTTTYRQQDISRLESVIAGDERWCAVVVVADSYSSNTSSGRHIK